MLGLLIAIIITIAIRESIAIILMKIMMKSVIATMYPMNLISLIVNVIITWMQIMMVFVVITIPMRLQIKVRTLTVITVMSILVAITVKIVVVCIKSGNLFTIKYQNVTCLASGFLDIINRGKGYI